MTLCSHGSMIAHCFQCAEVRGREDGILHERRRVATLVLRAADDAALRHDTSTSLLLSKLAHQIYTTAESSS